MEKPKPNPRQRKPAEHRSGDSASFKLKAQQTGKTLDWPMRLNKYIAASGLCARRAAGDMVKEGKIKVNGETVLEPGIMVEKTDVVEHLGKILKPTESFVYILLNKPKNYLTTTADERGRHSVLELIPESEKKRLFPVGRLDRNTTGLLLITNDGDLAQKLTHPSNNVKKSYNVELNRPVQEKDMVKIAEGITLEDGLTEVDGLAWPDPSKKHKVLLEIHSGKNRIIRRIFEHLGYEVIYLDRVEYAGLSKKALPRGRYRHLTDREIIMLRHFTGRSKNLKENKSGGKGA